MMTDSAQNLTIRGVTDPKNSLLTIPHHTPSLGPLDFEYILQTTSGFYWLVLSRQTPDAIVEALETLLIFYTRLACI